ncbi:MAG: DUF1859 domain-containing protein [Candidatus Micrarchaeaceae archaeon]
MNTPNVQNNNKALFFNPKSFTFILNFSSSNQTIDITNTYYTTQGITMDKVQSVYVDNTQSSTNTVININNTSQNIIVTPESVGVYPLFLNNNSIITVTNQTTSTATVTLIFTEKTLQPAIISGANSTIALLNLLESLENQTTNYLGVKDTTIATELLNQITNYIATKDININNSYNSTFEAIKTLNSNTFAIPPYDYVSYAYNSNNNVTQAVFKQGGSSGTTVATLNYTYSGTNVASVALTPTI